MTAVAPRRSLALSGLALLALALTGGCTSMTWLTPPKVETVTLQPSSRWVELNRVAVIDIWGFMSSSGGGLFRWSGTDVADVNERLERARHDLLVRAVVLRINSPGGDVTAADVMHRQITAFRRKTRMPVVACFMNVAASGGYYAACACDRIVAAPTSITGSVGVIMQLYDAEQLLEKVGIRPVAIKSGDKKDIGSLSRRMTPEERRILQGINDELFARFLRVVREGRPDLPESSLKAIRDGRVVTAPEALKLGMVDRLGYLEDAIEEAKRLAGITSADVIAYRTGYDPNVNLYATTRASSRNSGAAELLHQGLRALLPQIEPGFYYLWAPGR